MPVNVMTPAERKLAQRALQLRQRHLRFADIAVLCGYGSPADAKRAIGDLLIETSSTPPGDGDGAHDRAYHRAWTAHQEREAGFTARLEAAKKVPPKAELEAMVRARVEAARGAA